MYKLIFSISLFFCSASAYANNMPVNLDTFLQGGSVTGRIVQIMALLSVISLAPSILVMTTSFTRIIVVLSFLRNAIGLQQSPPAPVLISLALFLTFFVMGPTLEESYTKGVSPFIEEKINEEQAWKLTTAPLHKFMSNNVRQEDLRLFIDLSKSSNIKQLELVPLRILIPAFMISELRRAFEIGFLLFLPFLVIDMVVASVLMAMGMMMLPPMIIALPLKIIFFVLIDGWHLIASSLVRCYN